MGDVRTVSASSDDSACAPTPLATSSPTGDLSEEELRAVCALWSEAFPTAPGRDRYAEAVARLATAGATAEMVHAVFERDGACVAAARPSSASARRRRPRALAHVVASSRARGRASAPPSSAPPGRASAAGSTTASSAAACGLLAARRRAARCDVEYPSASSKRFVDPTMLRVATAEAEPWPPGATIRANGDGW
ncbi:hypothetical protein JL722_3701 [Aureococcus anophagefferens]|nr:hypothetical protein JL722_3701 [Aureococcus anophagefferens]